MGVVARVYDGVTCEQPENHVARSAVAVRRIQVVMGSKRWPCAGLLVAALLLGCGHAGWAGGLTPEEARGKRIFLHGQSEAGRMITARVGRSSTPMPGKTFPCASCHGSDGHGRPEGGVVPADISWSRLTTPLVSTGGAERARSAYSDDLIGRAITRGLNADGATLDATMPRFEMHGEDLRDLLSYLRRIEQDLDPGLTAQSIALGTIVPKGGVPDALGPVIAAVLKGYVQDVNEQGGIYSRRLELTVKEAATREQAVEHATALAEQGEIFAVVSPVTTRVEQEIERLSDAYAMPMIGPLTESPRSDERIQRHIFYLLSGLATEAKVLLSFAGSSLTQGPVKLAVVHPTQEAMVPVVEAVRQQAQTSQWPEPVVVAYDTGAMPVVDAVAQLKSAKITLLLFLGSDAEFMALAQEGVRTQWTPTVLMPSRSAGPKLFDMPTEFAGRIFLAFSNMPAPSVSGKGAEFAAFRARHRLPAHHVAAQASAYAAALVLTEGLKRVGSQLSRERLIDTLEQLYEFQTGVTPPLSYSPNRRIGSQGAQIVEVDIAQRGLHPVSPWMADR